MTEVRLRDVEHADLEVSFAPEHALALSRPRAC